MADAETAGKIEIIRMKEIKNGCFKESTRS